MRATRKALMKALLYPFDTLVKLEAQGDNSGRMALNEECKMLPMGAVWDWYCERDEMPAGVSWLEEARAYEQNVMWKRG
jgi:L-rhamnose isomerase